jgi:two-component system, cell cycle sensor histidine kinase and response regulator CckA
MRLQNSKNSAPAKAISSDWHRLEARQIWLSSTGIVVSLLLTAGIVSFVLPAFIPGLNGVYSIDTSLAVHGLVGLVLVFDLYVVFQQLQLYRVRKGIAEREELFRLISENAADLIAVVDTNGRRLYNSPSYQKLLGYSVEELKGTSGFEQIHPDDREKLLEAAAEAKSSGHGRRVEYRIQHKDGHWLTLESTASVIRNRAGNVEKLVIVNRDITERKQFEAQVLLSQKLEAIGRLSGGVAHDFNNLLGVIIGYSEELQKRITPEDPYREAVDEIRDAGKRAAALTQHLLAFSKKQVLEPCLLNLITVVGDVGKMLQRVIGEDIALEIIAPPSIGVIKADRTQIERVILNLAVNARDAMPSGGKLTIELSDIELDEEASRSFPAPITAGSYVLLRATDTGCGMDANIRDHIFEPFFTTKEKGTGLGLATVYGVIKQSSGYILVESEPGHGATFKIYLPHAAEALTSAAEHKPFTGSTQEPRTILLVEDEPALLKLTRTTLKTLGHTVLEAKDAFQALEISKLREAPIDLLLTDVIMPGMSGPTLADNLLPLRPELKVLYMTGYSDGAIAKQGILEDGVSLLRKPFTKEELAQRVEEVLFGVFR